MAICFPYAIEGQPPHYARGPCEEDEERGWDSTADELYELVQTFDDRSAYVQSTFAFCKGRGHKPVLFVGKCEGTIVERRAPRRGDNLYGWNSVFRPLRQEKTLAEMGEEEKDKIGHEGEALRQLKKYLEANADKLLQSLAEDGMPKAGLSLESFIQERLTLSVSIMDPDLS